jgi:hypothetical protein
MALRQRFCRSYSCFGEKMGSGRFARFGSNSLPSGSRVAPG